MKRKTIVISVCTLLIATVLPVMATQNIEKKELPSCGIANTSDYCGLGKVQVQNDLKGLNERNFSGYCVWNSTSTLAKGPVSFNPADPGNITQIEKSKIFISGGTWALGKWYGCEFGLGDENQPLIWTIHPVIGIMTQVGSYDPEGTNLSFNGLAYDLTTGIMYGCSSTDLYKVNMTNGASSRVGSFGITNGIMIALACDGSGNLYGAELTTDSLYSINHANGAATPIGSGLGIDINYAQDMEFDIDSGILYLSAYTIAPIREGALYTCSPVTGVATKVGTFQGAAEITGLAIPYCGIPHIVPTSISGGILKNGQSTIQCTIKNIGGLTCINVTLKITSSRGLILDLGTNQIIPSIPPGGEVNITSSMIIGIARPRKTLTITAIDKSCGTTDIIVKNAIVFGILWWC